MPTLSQNPANVRRRLMRSLNDNRNALASCERMVKGCLPEYRSAIGYRNSVRNIPMYKQRIAELEAELQAVPRG